MTARPDVCLAINSHGIAFRSNEDGVQLRVIDHRWSLPSGVTGSVTVGVGGWSQSFDIDDNTSEMVNAETPQDDLAEMFSRMDKATSMTIAVGKAKPLQVSLVGSTKATTAFRTCAGVTSNSASPESNPFK
ncbi:MAG TPA: hypothetical protein VGM32_06020 [Rhodopila sp.]